jgi:hypothetical protein
VTTYWLVPAFTYDEKTVLVIRKKRPSPRTVGQVVLLPATI